MSDLVRNKLEAIAERTQPQRDRLLPTAEDAKDLAAFMFAQANRHACGGIAALDRGDTEAGALWLREAENAYSAALEEKMPEREMARLLHPKSRGRDCGDADFARMAAQVDEAKRKYNCSDDEAWGRVDDSETITYNMSVTRRMRQRALKRGREINAAKDKPAKPVDHAKLKETEKAVRRAVTIAKARNALAK